jgi:hypothetical protein
VRAFATQRLQAASLIHWRRSARHERQRRRALEVQFALCLGWGWGLGWGICAPVCERSHAGAQG